MVGVARLRLGVAVGLGAGDALLLAPPRVVVGGVADVVVDEGVGLLAVGVHLVLTVAALGNRKGGDTREAVLSVGGAWVTYLGRRFEMRMSMRLMNKYQDIDWVIDLCNRLPPLSSHHDTLTCKTTCANLTRSYTHTHTHNTPTHTHATQHVDTMKMMKVWPERDCMIAKGPLVTGAGRSMGPSTQKENGNETLSLRIIQHSNQKHTECPLCKALREQADKNGL